MCNLERTTYDQAITKLKTYARVALHFHPDRPDPTMRSVAENLLEQGVYKSQFETFLSNGSVSAYPGGHRDVWERQLFNGAYDGAAPNERPKYGALDIMLHPDGPAPRFGSCYFLLSPEVSRRCTYTYSDSHQNPKEKGTYEQLDLVLSALLSDAFFRDFAIGEKNISVSKLIRHMLVQLEQPFQPPCNKAPNRNLNHYIEAQIHGDISLRDDVSILVADPSFKGTSIGGVLEQICLKYAIKLYWHMGFVLSMDDVPMDFRGPSMPSLARAIARNGLIDASVIGLAAMDLKRNPDAWSDRGTYEQVLQELKLMWHVLVRYGKPMR